MEFIKYWLFKLFHPTATTLRRRSGALGDNLLLSTLARELNIARPNKKIILETAYPELFKYNPHVDLAVKGKVSLFYSKIKYRIEPSTKTHLIDQMISQLPVKIEKFNRSCDLYFGDYDFSYLELPEKYIVINPSGKQSHTANRKEWGWQNFAKLRKRFENKYFIQIGDTAAERIPNVLDFRGLSVMESAWIIKNAMTGIFLEGGLMHLADAVDRPCVIIYGGVVDTSISAYDKHTNIATQPKCSPCFTSHQAMDICSTMECMDAISVETVFNAVNELISGANNSQK